MYAKSHSGTGERAVGQHNLAVVILVVVLFLFMRWLLMLVFYNELFHWCLMALLSVVVTSYMLPATIAVGVLLHDAATAVTSEARERFTGFVRDNYALIDALVYAPIDVDVRDDEAKYLSVDNGDQHGAGAGKVGVRGRVELTVAAFEAAMASAIPSEKFCDDAGAGFDAILREALPDSKSDTVNVVDVTLEDGVGAGVGAEVGEEVDDADAADGDDDREGGGGDGEVAVASTVVIPDYVRGHEEEEEDDDESSSRWDSGSGSNTYLLDRRPQDSGGAASERFRPADAHIVRYFSRASRRLRFGSDMTMARRFDVNAFRAVVEDDLLSMWNLKCVASPVRRRKTN